MALPFAFPNSTCYLDGEAYEKGCARIWLDQDRVS